MRPLLAAALIVATAVLPGRASESFGGSNAFSFVALGDMPYFLPDDVAKVDRLIAATNALKPAFTLHIGDVKSANTPCDDAIYKARLEQLQSFAGPLVYPVGGNESTDWSLQ